MGGGEANARTGLAALLGLGLAALLLGLAAAPLDRHFDTDEFQHLQMAWLIHEGVVPYRDFFEHHTPLFHFALQPLFSALDVERVEGDAVASVHVGRAQARVLALALVLGAAALGASVAGRWAGAGAALALASLSFFVHKGLEIRPDHFGALGLVACALALLAAARRADAPGRGAARLACFTAAGAAAAVALFSTQKTLLAWPGIGVSVWLAARQRPGAGTRGLAAACAAGAAGALLVAVPLLLWFAVRGALDEFFRLNFLLNASWPARTGLARVAGGFVAQNPLVLALAAAGVAIGVRGVRRRDAGIALAPLASLVAGLFVIPIALAQYYFLALPFLAVFAGVALAAAVERARGAAGRAAAAALIAAVAASGARHLAGTYRARDTSQALAKLEYAVTQTPVSATVLSSWSPGLAYRRPAFFYWSLHREIRQVISEAEYEALRHGLESGRIAPELVEMDKHMKRLPEPIVRHLEAHYAPVGLGTLWRRSDAGAATADPAAAPPTSPTAPGTPGAGAR